MSFFTNRFLQRKAPGRKFSKCLTKSEDDVLNSSAITLNLGDLKTTFDNGRWIPEYGPGSETNRQNSSLKMEITRLEEENNLLRLKYEILLDMVTQESTLNNP